MNVKFDLNDIVIVPSTQSEIVSRKECNVKTELNKLPLIASPMDTVVSEENIEKYINCGIIPCIPRGQQIKKFIPSDYFFKSYSLSEIEKILDEVETTHTSSLYYKNVLIDMANGNMTKLINVIKKFKIHFNDINLMVGNIANPETYKILSEAGADYVRCSIGSGNSCTTAANVSINYPLGSLISECRSLKETYHLNAKIVADGGMRNYSDIIKSLALGADYVMIGSLFNKAIESAGFNYLFGVRINNKMALYLWKWKFPIKKKYRGMSTKAVQRSWGKTKLTTAEGIIKYQKVEYTLCQWTENL